MQSDSPQRKTECSHKIRILLIDEGCDFLIRIQEMLEQTDLDVELECATTVIAAINAFSRSVYDAVIIDSVEHGARSLLAAARRVGCSSPLLVLTSNDGGEVLEALHDGATDCIMRDRLSPQVLERTICSAIERAGLVNWHNDNEQRYLSLVDNASDIIYTHDLEGNYTSVNRAVLQLTGYTKEEALQLKVPDVVAPEYLEYARKMTIRKVDEQSLTSYEMEIISKDGQRVPVDVSTHLIYRNGIPVAVQGIARDIRHRRESEAALRLSEERYRELFENANDIVYTHDLEGNFTSLNRSGERVTGYTREEAMALDVTRVVAPEHLANVRSRMAEKTHLKDSTLYQLDLIRKDGQRVLLEINSQLIFKDGKPHSIQGIGRDITERKKPDEALRTSEQRYRQIVNEAHEVICRISLSGHFTFVNPIAARLMNCSEEELVGRSFLELVRPDYRSITQEFYQQQIRQRISATYFEFPVTSNDGKEIWLGQSLQLIFENGRVREMQAVARDITDRKAMEQSLRKSEERYRAFVDHSSEGVCCVEFHHPCPVDLDLEQQIEHVFEYGFVVECNEQMARMYGRSYARELMGAGFGDLLSRDDARNRECLKSFIQRGYRLSDAETRSNGIAGNTKWFLNNLIGVIENDKVVRIWGTHRDITESRRAAEILNEANERALKDYDRLVERIATLGQTLGQAREVTTVLRAVKDFAVVSTPCDGIVISLYDEEKQNRRAAYCWTDGEEFDPAGMTTVPVRDGVTGTALKTGKILIENNFENLSGTILTIGNCGGNRIPRSALSAPMAVMGRVIGCIEIQSYDAEAYRQEHANAMHMAANLAATAIENVELNDRERENEAQLLQSQKMEAVGQLAGGVAHDFNNLLTAISGYSDLSLHALRPEHPVHRNLEEIKKASSRAASLTRQLLAFSRKQMFQAKDVDLNDIVGDIDKMLRRLIGEDIELVTKLAEKLCTIKADPGQIEQVILNLAVNARDALPTGGKLTIETKHAVLTDGFAKSHFALPPGRYVMLAVSDNGRGMDEETKLRMFEPFFTTKEIGKGTGLGLSTVYGIVKQSGGYIWTYSELGKGTTVKIYLPAADEASATGEQDCQSLEDLSGRGTILLVEDEEMVRNLTTEVLQECGYEVLTASNGKEACDVCAKHPGDISLLITDVVMPQMGGRELADWFSRIRPKAGVLYMSGYTDDAIVRHGVLDAEIPFLQKPFSPNALAGKVRELLTDSQASVAA